MTQPSWFFEKKAEMGGASADAFRSTLSGLGIPKEDLFIREAVQNSVDAAREDGDGRVRVRIVEKMLRGAELERFLYLVRLRGDDGPAARQGLLRTDDGDRSLEELIGDELRILVVEDHGTSGLTGREDPGKTGPKDRYRNLCLELGTTEPPQQGRGGTFGFGKAVYWVSSRLWTTVVYSRFRPETGNEERRAMGISWFRSHSHPADSDEPGHQYTGRAWIGRVEGERARPLTGVEADRWAEELGFEVRGKGDTGLSIAILGCDLDLDKVVEGVEKHWWPRVLAGKLEVEAVRSDGEILRPNPRENESLVRFVRAWDLLADRVEKGENDDIEVLTYKRRSLGRCAITAEGETAAPLEEEDGKNLRIALVRGPGMVVEYYEGPRMGHSDPASSGLFVADDGVDPILARSEPPAHNRWDPRTTRAERPLEEDDRKLIENLFTKLRKFAREFLKERRDPPPEQPERCTELEKLLGKYFGYSKGREPRPPSGRDPFSIEYLEEPRREYRGDEVFLRAKVALGLARRAGGEPVKARVLPEASTTVDRHSRGEKIPIRSIELDLDHHWIEPPEVPSTQAEGVLEIGPGEPALLTITTEALPHEEFPAEFYFTAEEVEEDA